MTLQDIERIGPPKLTIREAAEIMDVTPRFLQLVLKQRNGGKLIGCKMKKIKKVF